MQNPSNQNISKEENIIMGILRPSPTEEELKNRIPITEEQLQAIKENQEAHRKAWYLAHPEEKDLG